ncbi:MAG: hypothetical protein ABSG76_22755 [Xanthobacteraceae bacterium]|jgi:hypothetical protein
MSALAAATELPGPADVATPFGAAASLRRPPRWPEALAAYRVVLDVGKAGDSAPRSPTRNNGRSAAIMCRDRRGAIQCNFNSTETPAGEFMLFHARQRRLAGAHVRRAFLDYAHTIAQIRSIFGPKTSQFALHTAVVRGASDSPMAIVPVGYSAKGDEAWPSRQSGSQRWQAFGDACRGAR